MKSVGQRLRGVLSLIKFVKTAVWQRVSSCVMLRISVNYYTVMMRFHALAIAPSTTLETSVWTTSAPSDWPSRTGVAAMHHAHF